MRWSGLSGMPDTMSWQWLSRNAQALDSEVIDLAVSDARLLLTEDKDFGQLVFAHAEPSLGVVLLRYPSGARGEIGGDVVDLVVSRLMMYALMSYPSLCFTCHGSMKRELRARTSQPPMPLAIAVAVATARVDQERWSP